MGMKNVENGQYANLLEYGVMYVGMMMNIHEDSRRLESSCLSPLSLWELEISHWKRSTEIFFTVYVISVCTLQSEIHFRRNIAAKLYASATVPLSFSLFWMLYSMVTVGKNYQEHHATSQKTFRTIPVRNEKNCAYEQNMYRITHQYKQVYFQ